jgi:hypothetical protein
MFVSFEQNYPALKPADMITITKQKADRKQTIQSKENPEK